MKKLARKRRPILNHQSYLHLPNEKKNPMSKIGCRCEDEKQSYRCYRLRQRIRRARAWEKCLMKKKADEETLAVAVLRQLAWIQPQLLGCEQHQVGGFQSQERELPIGFF